MFRQQSVVGTVRQDLKLNYWKIIQVLDDSLPVGRQVGTPTDKVYGIIKNMKESFPSPLSPEKNSKEEVLAAYHKFVERGIKSPDELDSSDPEVAEANALFYKWQKEIGDDPRANFEKNKFYVDAGFTDPSYLSDVLSWLFQDAGDLEKNPDDTDTTQLRKDYADEMRKIRRMLGQPEIE